MHYQIIDDNGHDHGNKLQHTAGVHVAVIPISENRCLKMDGIALGDADKGDKRNAAICDVERDHYASGEAGKESDIIQHEDKI